MDLYKQQFQLMNYISKEEPQTEDVNLEDEGDRFEDYKSC